GVADLCGDLAEFVAEGDAVGDRIGAEDRGHAPVECVCEWCSLTAPAREFDGFAAQRVATRARRLVAKRSRQPREEPRAKLDLVVGYREERILEQRYQSLVGAGTRDHAAPAVPDGRAGELGRQADPPCECRGLEEVLL